MMKDSPLVTTEWLESRLDDSNVRVVEVFSRREGLDPGTEHIPGAAAFYWKDLCWHPTDREFVSPEQLGERLGAVGIGADTTVVLVGEPVQFGTYAYWALLMAGHRHLKIVDGARKIWVAEGRPMTRARATFTPVECALGPGPTDMRVGREYVRAGLGRPGRGLLDVRSPEEYSGERVMAYGEFDHGAERGGRIPGAKHLYYGALLNEDDTYRTPDEIRAALRDVGADPAEIDELVCYCRLSHRASLAWVAMTYLLGADNVRIYDGSWTEWGSIVGFPVER